MGLVRAPDEQFEDIPGYDYDANYVDVGGPEMAYVDVAGDGAETFLCLHGEPTWSYLYRKMIPTLSEVGRVVVPDLVGFGRSDKWTDREAYTYDAMYETVENFVTELNLQNVTLVCQDWGGLLGLPVAANNPERFARLVPMNTGLPDGSQTMPDIWHQFKDMMADPSRTRITWPVLVNSPRGSPSNPRCTVRRSSVTPARRSPTGRSRCSSSSRTRTQLPAGPVTICGGCSRRLPSNRIRG